MRSHTPSDPRFVIDLAQPLLGCIDKNIHLCFTQYKTFDLTRGYARNRLPRQLSGIIFTELV